MRQTILAALIAVVAVACGIPGGEDETTPAFATTTTIPEAQTTPGGAGTVGEWRCGEAKRALYAAVAVLSQYETALDPMAPAIVAEPGELTEAVETASTGFTVDDQQAQDTSCRLFGQHDAALELWQAGNRGDACDVWLPADEHASQAEIQFDALHPLSAQMWVAATGQVSEGVGRCIAERAN